MKRLNLLTLLVNDDDLDCFKKEPSLDNISLASMGFILPDLEKYNCIIYKGKLGTKILKLNV